MKHTNLYLGILASAGSLVSSTYNSYCQGGKVHFNFPYENQETANVLKLSAGTCDETSNDQTHVSTDYADSTFSLEVDVANCGINPGNDDIFEADIMVILGSNDGGVDLIFHNATISIECGTQTDYQVEFVYTPMQPSDDPDNNNNNNNGTNNGNNNGDNGISFCSGGVVIDGVCHFDHGVTFDFEIKEFSDSTFGAEVNSSNSQHIAGERIYLAINGLGLTNDRRWIVEKCQVQSDTKNYTLFDANINCENNVVDLNVNWASNNFKLDHVIFMLEKEISEMKLVCDIKVCDATDASSECFDLGSKCFSSTQVEEFNCGGCANGEFCEIVNNVPSCSQKTCDCENGDGSVGVDCPNTGDFKCGSCDSGFELIAENSTCVVPGPLPTFDCGSQDFIDAIPRLYPNSCDGFDPNSFPAVVSNLIKDYSSSPVESAHMKVWYFTSAATYHWHEGYAFCKANGLEYSQVHSYEESIEAFEVTDSRVWYGGSRKIAGTDEFWPGAEVNSQDKSIWYWTNGQRICYDNWRSGEPSGGSSPPEYYTKLAHASTPTWNDMSDAAAANIVCEYRCAK